MRWYRWVAVKLVSADPSYTKLYPSGNISLMNLSLQGLLAAPVSSTYRSVHINHHEPLEEPQVFPDNRIVSSKVSALFTFYAFLTALSAIDCVRCGILPHKTA